MDVFTNRDLSEKEATACLIAIVHLFQKLYITDINQKFLDKIIAITKTAKNHELTKFALSVIHKILCHRDPTFAKWKEEVTTELKLESINKFSLLDDPPDYDLRFYGFY